jgi:hypothetical protein
LPNFLHEGEREAIALASEQGAQLPVDEIRARRVASDLGIEVFGTLRILIEAKRLGHIDLVRPILVEMQSAGYRFDRALIRQFLERFGPTYKANVGRAHRDEHGKQRRTLTFVNTGVFGTKRRGGAEGVPKRRRGR